MWPETYKAKTEKRYELVLIGDDISKRVESSGALDEDIYGLTHLNFLRVSKTPLVSMSDALGQMTNLTNLVMDGNKLTSLPDSIGSLDKLKVLDVSFNELESLPKCVGQLSNLTTLNASCNKLTTLPDFEDCISLQIMDVGRNSLTEFPNICHEALATLAEVTLSNNQITDLPTSLRVLPMLKLLDLEGNSIKVCPGEMTDCIKLKDLNLKGNPLTDRRFRKLVENDRSLPKMIIDYLKQLPKVEAQEGKAGGKGKKGKGGKGKAKEPDQVDEMMNELHVLSLSDQIPVVQVEESVKEVRPYIVCCILQKIDLTGDKLKKFISTQTKLHEGICEKRLAATIATHDLTKIKSPLKYTARDPKAIRIHPLIKNKEVSAKALHHHLKQEAEAQRKAQKRNNVSGLHKYLHIVDNWNVWPCLEDAEGAVVSLPPITNSENTKITEETTDIFIEVTSSRTLGKAKEVLDALLLATLHSNLCTETTPAGKVLMTVQQVKVQTELDGNLRVLYPSRTDLVYENERIQVIMPEK